VVPTDLDHKYSRGTLGVITGSAQYPGAAVLFFSGNISPIGELKVLVRLRSATIGERKAIKTWGVAVVPKKTRVRLMYGFR
jgi:hypothetical protein